MHRKFTRFLPAGFVVSLGQLLPQRCLGGLVQNATNVDEPVRPLRRAENLHHGTTRRWIHLGCGNHVLCYHSLSELHQNFNTAIYTVIAKIIRNANCVKRIVRGVSTYPSLFWNLYLLFCLALEE